jgi:hypothetical protein
MVMSPASFQCFKFLTIIYLLLFSFLCVAKPLCPLWFKRFNLLAFNNGTQVTDFVERYGWSSSSVVPSY